VDGDGYDDLIIASGRGGRLACYRNDGHGGFQRLLDPPLDTVVARDQTTVLGWSKRIRNPQSTAHTQETVILTGSANYEDGLAAGSSVRRFDLANKVIDDGLPGDPASTGPLALADVHGDGRLDLFVGGRVLPGRYPESASSRLYRFDGARFQLDSTNSNALENVGMVSGAVWSDLDGDGLPELILACEWGPVKIFRNNKGNLVPWDARLTFPAAENLPAAGASATLNQLTGWWSGITTGDLDGDGRLDIVAANWGLNSDYLATRERPLPLYYGDLLGRGADDLLETEWNSVTARWVPRRRLDVLGRALPFLMERFRSHQTYSEAPIDEVLGPDPTRWRKVDAATLASMIFFNRGDHFEAVALPAQAQLAPAFGVNIADFDGDGHEDIFLSQNFFALPAETPRLDAGRGLLLLGDGTGKFAAAPGQESGLEIYGEQRGAAVADFDGDGRADLVVTQNGGATRLFRNIRARPGLRVRLAGPIGNPNGVGATLRLKSGALLGPAREIHAGSGYWSQDSSTQVLASSGASRELSVRWPGGATSTVLIPLNSTQITVTNMAAARVAQP
jgi:hypothetical protein